MRQTKKRMITMFTIACLLCFGNAKSQGFFGLFNDYIINDQKLTDLKLVVLNANQLSPSSVVDWGFTATTKKGKEIATVNLPDGKYKYKPDFTFESDNAVLIDGTVIKVKPVNEIKGDVIHIKITMKSKSDEASIAIATLNINYEGVAAGSYEGKRGRPAQQGASGGNGGTFFGRYMPPSNGNNGGSNAEYGSDGKSLEAFAKVESVNGTPMLRVVVQNNSDGTKDYYQVKAGRGSVLINACGGTGGSGGSGGNGGDGAYPGDGGDGNDGGNGGMIILHIDPSAKAYEQSIKADVQGGKGGNGGIGGNARVAPGSNNYNYGKQGRDGRMGRMGKIEFKYETVTIGWY